LAAGVYNTDLKDINLCETTTDFSALGGGGAGLGAGVDFAIQGTNAVDKQVSNSLKGMVYDTGSAITLGADEHIFIWMICSTPGITSIQSLGGLRITVGTATNAYREWYVNGSDTLPEGGMNNYAIHTSSTADNTQGSPGANPQFFGGQADVTATSRGVNFALDAMRYGTGFYLTEGDATTPITFESASVVNDSNANRYGIFEAIPGGFSQKGRFVIGQDPNFNTTQSYFIDNNKSILFKDTPQSLSDFSQIIIDHPSTFFSLRAITLTAEGTNNPGQIIFNDSSTTGSIVNCQFNSIGKTFLKANVQTTGSSFNSTDTIFQSGSTIFDSVFRTTTGVSSSMLVDDPSKLSFNTFDNEGSKHGIEVVVTGSYVFQANIFNNFDSGSNANEALYFNPPGGTGDLTLQVTGGGTTVEFRNASSGTVTIENNASITVTQLKDNTEVRIFSTTELDPGGGQLELAGIENATDGTTDNRSFTFSLPVGTIVDIVLISVQYENERLDDFELTVSQDLPFEQVLDRNYSNPPNEIQNLFSSLESRATFFENHTESEEFPTFLEDNNFLSSASLVYVAAGYSSGSIQSLIPSSSAGDMLIVDTGIFLRPGYPQYLSRINDEGYVITGSTGGLVPLNYSSTDLGKSGSFCSVPDFFPTSTVNKWVDGIIFRNDFTTFSTGSNTVFTQSAAGISTPQGPVQGENNAARLTDDNSGGSKEVFFTQTISVTDNSQFQYTTFASSSGADWLYISASFQNGSCVSWFDITNGVTGSVTDNSLLDGVFDVQSFPDNWKRVGMQFELFGLGSGSLTVGIADADNSKTVTADGNASMLVWGNNSPRLNSAINSNARMVPFHFTSNTTAIPDFPLSSSLPGGVLTEGTLYVEGAFNYTPLASGSGNSNPYKVGLVNSTDESEFFEIQFNYGLVGSFIICRYETSAGNGSTQFGAGLIPYEYFNDNKMAKVAIRIKDGDYRASCNGSDATFNPAELPPLDKLVVNRGGNNSGRFKTIAVFDKALTNTELNNLTSY